MKTFKLTMMAAMLAFAGTAMAQELTPITAADLSIKNGETADLVIKVNYDNQSGAPICGASFSLYLPDGIIFAEFDSKEAQDAAKTSALKKCFSLTDEGGVWDDPDDGWFNKCQKKNDGGFVVVVIDQDDKTEFDNITDATLVIVPLKAVEDVTGTIKIADQALTNTKNVSVGMKDGSSMFSDYEVGVNNTSVGINEIQGAEATAPAYNLQGIRVNNAKGLIIRDGKKMIVK